MTKLHSSTLFLSKTFLLDMEKVLGWGWGSNGNGQSILMRTAISFSLISEGLRSKWGSNTFLDITRKGFQEAINNKCHSGVSQDSSQNQMWQGSFWPLEEMNILFLLVSSGICASSFLLSCASVARPRQRKGRWCETYLHEFSLANNYPIHSLFNSTLAECQLYTKKDALGLARYSGGWACQTWPAFMDGYNLE